MNGLRSTRMRWNEEEYDEIGWNGMKWNQKGKEWNKRNEIK